MPRNGDRSKTDLLAKVAAEAKGKLESGQVAAMGSFLSHYYANVPPGDLKDRSAASLFGAAYAHFRLGATRAAGRTVVRAYVPTIEEHGWHSERTVIEIVTDDMPFLVDSVASELARRGMSSYLVIHPIFAVTRDKSGHLQKVAAPAAAPAGAGLESFMWIEIPAQAPAVLKETERALEGVLADVRSAVTDWKAMRDRMAAIVDSLAGTDAPDVAEAREFLRWSHQNHFTFLGYREYELKGRGTSTHFSVRADGGLGILRDPAAVVFEEIRDNAPLPPEARRFVERPDLLMITKTSRLSTVHRAVRMDAVAIKQRDAKGKVIGEQVFVGLFTSGAYSRSPRDIPLLRRKIERVLERAGFPAGSHDAKALAHILETYPRDELFQISEDDLLDISVGILHLQERQRVALFVRNDDFDRFVSCLVYVPRERYTTDLRKRIEAILVRAFAGEVTVYHTLLGDSPLARLSMTIATPRGRAADADLPAIEAELAEAARSWADRLQEALVTARGEEQGLKLAARYAEAFSPGYRDHVAPAAAIGDIALIEKTIMTGDMGVNLYRPIGAGDHQVRFKIYSPGRRLPLSEVMPVLENMGLRVLDEIDNTVRPDGRDDAPVMIQDFGLETRDKSAIELGLVRDHYHEAFRRIWNGDAESDGFNALVLFAGLAWRQVAILRAYSRSLRQAGIPFSLAYMEETLNRHPKLARQIVELFMTLFDPEGSTESEKRVAALREKLNEGLNAVASADEDRILRRFVNAVESTLRTNYFQRAADAAPKPYISFKFDSSKLDELPLPRPLREIFVYSPRMEGVHLRFGMVARGGIRWSDRREDFRTEILGLVKAQQVKNAVIVPVGSKGGFVLKRAPSPSDREAFMAEGIACYKTLISGMLDITDNIVANKVVPPVDVVRRDGDDPYLVVAADKGTATFSDIANGVSADYKFWLGDAFASGGSQGYDHKKMGITARGAWESVKRHFREMGHDTQTQNFTVAGVGDMSGDVFGNGMLQSKHIKLIAAFDHRHIFIDPDPDPAKSYVERERMFNLPRSSWADYDTKVLSKGGGIHDRKAKTLTLSPEARRCLGLEKEMATPNEVMTAILKADVDLMFFGGIGSYIKASTESHAEAGDRANDAIRINGAQVRAKVIGEGANLGVTQRGRIEYGLKGGRLNTDSIDNSAGVDCSDHEVNIKILVDSVAAAGDLTPKQRNELLAQMTEEVGLLVLRDNYLQTQAISLVESMGVGALDSQTRLMRMLERAGRLNRAVEYLPDEETLAERAAAKRGLTRPENAILMSYAKIWLYDEILPSDLPDDPHLEQDLYAYFPGPIRERYKAAALKHRLKREIIATSVTNSLVNRVGGTFVPEFVERVGAKPADIARAYVIVREAFQLRTLWHDIEALDNKVPAAVQTAMLHQVNHLIAQAVTWFLRNGRRPLDLGQHVAEFKDGIATLTAAAGAVLPPHYAEDLKVRAKAYVKKGVPEALALRVAGLVNLYSACDIVRLAGKRGLDVEAVAKAYFAIGTRFRLGRLRAACADLDAATHWQKLAVAALVEEIYGHQLALADQVLDCGGTGGDAAGAVAAWAAKNKTAVESADQLLGEMWVGVINDLAQVAVASRQLRALVQSAAG